MPSAGDRYAVLLGGSPHPSLLTAEESVALTAASSKIDFFLREVVNANGYQRQRVGRIVTAIAAGVFTVPGHGLSNGQIVFIAGSNLGGSYLPPTGIQAGMPHYVVSATADSFMLSATSGGSSIPVPELPAGATIVLPGGSYDGVDRRHESMVETVRFQGLGTGYSHSGLAIIRGGHPLGRVPSAALSFTLPNQVVVSTGHSLVAGDEVFFSRRRTSPLGNLPNGIDERIIYFARPVSATVFTVHPTRAEAIAGSNAVQFINVGSNDRWLHYANGIIESFETFTTATLANGASQPFFVTDHLLNAGNIQGL